MPARGRKASHGKLHLSKNFLKIPVNWSHLTFFSSKTCRSEVLWLTAVSAQTQFRKFQPKWICESSIIWWVNYIEFQNHWLQKAGRSGVLWLTAVSAQSQFRKFQLKWFCGSSIIWWVNNFQFSKSYEFCKEVLVLLIDGCTAGSIQVLFASLTILTNPKFVTGMGLKSSPTWSESERRWKIDCVVTYPELSVVAANLFGFRQPHTTASKIVFIFLCFDFFCCRILKAERKDWSFESSGGRGIGIRERAF